MKGDAPFVNRYDENEKTYYNLSKQTLTAPSHYLQTDSHLGVSRDKHTMEKNRPDTIPQMVPVSYWQSEQFSSLRETLLA